MSELRFDTTPTHVCQVCGYESSEAIIITIAPHEGRYCLRCYAKWIAEHVPRLDLISTRQQEKP